MNRKIRRKRSCFWPVMVLLLILSACGGDVSVSQPPPDSSQQEAKTAEQLLAEQPRDAAHNAFLVDTGGRLGTLLVTVEKGEQDPESWFGGFECALSVWNPQDMDAPIQTMTVLVEDMVFGKHEVVDADFDGYMDFGCQWFQGNQPTYWYFWIWDEEAGRFVEEPAFREISMPVFDPETETVSGWARSSGGGDGENTFHRWIDGELVCVRRIEVWYDVEDVVQTDNGAEIPYQMTVEDRIDGELTQVYYKKFSPDENFFPEREKWGNLEYHGESGYIAFLVDTGGRLGTLLVTVEKGEQDPESWFGGFECALSVWNPQDMDTPIQTMTILVEDMVFGKHEVVDADFDGYMDFGCQWFQGNQPTYWYFWIWDEEVGQFVEEPAFREISMPVFDPETETVSGWARSSGGGDGEDTFHRWIDGELVCVRRIEVWYDVEDIVQTDNGAEIPYQMTVEDRIDGELTQVYYKKFSPDESFFPEREKWGNLEYHGESEYIEEKES